MTYGDWEVVGRDSRELPLGTTLGDALRKLIRKRWPHNTAKTIEARWGLDRKTASNVVSQSNVSERTLTKAAVTEGWALWMALGEELFGESFADWEERRLQRIIDEAQRERETILRLREKSALVRERADRVAAALHRQEPEEGQRLAP